MRERSERKISDLAADAASQPPRAPCEALFFGQPDLSPLFKVSPCRAPCKVPSALDFGCLLHLGLFDSLEHLRAVKAAFLKECFPGPEAESPRKGSKEGAKHAAAVEDPAPPAKPMVRRAAGGIRPRGSLDSGADRM